ncbi:hypothetical protein [Paenibacillus planticolens]|uniref:Head decoration protein n=1 Tax=Paenibacillus planticolens TaxID=2654976 RepID=A0ABX1ZMR6_9BACL|nr:hypothetical protein [Paenibacillus planticolens]NOV01352.1 hypothetical protein [Paenibacillus planticolens]
MADFNFHVPGRTDGEVYVDKQICVHGDHHIHDRIAVTIAPNTGVLDKGTILGASTADSLYRPVRRSALTAAVGTAATTATVTDGSIFANSIGAAAALVKADGTGVVTCGTITAVNGNTVTISAPGTAFVIGDFLYVKDGSEKALLILGDFVPDAASNKIANAFVAGKFYQSQLVGVDAFVTKDLVARSIPFGLNAAGQNESIYLV